MIEKTDWPVSDLSEGVFPSIPVWDRRACPPRVEDIVLGSDGRYYVVCFIVHPSNRFICFRDGERRTFELYELQALIKASPNVGLLNKGGYFRKL